MKSTRIFTTYNGAKTKVTGRELDDLVVVHISAQVMDSIELRETAKFLKKEAKRLDARDPAMQDTTDKIQEEL